MGMQGLIHSLNSRGLTDVWRVRYTARYDAAGNRSRRVDARGWPTTYSMDPLGRTVGQIYIDGTRVTSIYDPAGRQTGMQDVTGITSMAYDAGGRQSAVVNGAGLALTYGYDATGERVSMQDPDGGMTTYGYDADGRLVGIANPYSELTTIGYDALGREVNKVLANSVTVSHSYDAAGREVGLSQVGPDGAAKAWYTASYDATGNRLGQAELDGSIVSYGYDNAGQLTHEARAGTEPYDITYVYDRVGNRTQEAKSGAVTTYSYNAADEQTNLLAPDGTVTTFGYDANGNTEVVNANGQVTTNSWDPENRLVGVVKPDATVEAHAYAANGLRQSKSVAGVIANFLWDQQNILQERDGALALLADYTLFPGYWGGLASVRRSGASSFYGFDLQGTTRALLDVLAGVTDEYWMTAFGEETASSGPSVNPFRYAGNMQYYRDLANLLQVRAREPRTDWGRWMSRDPIGRRGGPNLYGYAGNNPVVAIDPSGTNAYVYLFFGPKYSHGIVSCLEDVWYEYVGTHAMIAVQYPDRTADVSVSYARSKQFPKGQLTIRRRSPSDLSSASVMYPPGPDDPPGSHDNLIVQGYLIKSSPDQDKAAIENVAGLAGMTYSGLMTVLNTKRVWAGAAVWDYTLYATNCTLVTEYVLEAYLPVITLYGGIGPADLNSCLETLAICGHFQRHPHVCFWNVK